MENNTYHLCSLVGSTFIVASSHSTKEWSGDLSLANGTSDYESLENWISYEEGDLTQMEKSDNLKYYVYFSNSSKIELFAMERGFVICDGLYFNKSWDYSRQLYFNILSEIEIEFSISGNTLYVFDSVLVGESVINTHSNFAKFVDNCSIDLNDGIYKVYRVETLVSVENQKVLLKGVMVIQE
ncbi:MAG TPA: hypothetical protein PKD18_09000 [Saprospiraceae bacterium]|nr:hypothetical protein [Saprospiraceae bacterium]